MMGMCVNAPFTLCNSFAPVAAFFLYHLSRVPRPFIARRCNFLPGSGSEPSRLGGAGRVNLFRPLRLA
jgi:hypothetical protein